MPVLSETWRLLGENSKEIGAVGSILFGISGAIAAWLAFRLNYRNNFGQKPLLLLKTHGGTAGHQWAEMHCTFEVWNRRKYPVVVREMQVTFGEAKIDSGSMSREGDETEWW